MTEEQKNTSLIPTTGGAVAPQTGDDVFNKLVKSGDYLGYVTLVQANADLAKPNAPKRIEAGNYAYVKGTNVIDLGKDFTAGVIRWRPTARIVDKTGEGTKITSFHDPESEDFKAIQAAASVQQKNPKLLNYYGFEYLLWLEETECFATFYCNNATTRRHASEAIHPLMGKVTNWGSRFIETDAHSWYGPEVSKSDTDLLNAPTQEMIDTECERFDNPPENTGDGTSTEEVEEEAVADDDNR